MIPEDNRSWDLGQTRKVCQDIRRMQKPSHRLDAFLNLKKQLDVNTAGYTATTGVPFSEAEVALTVFEEIVSLYADLYHHNRKDIFAAASVYLHVSPAEGVLAQWRRVKAKFSQAPFCYTLCPCSTGNCSSAAASPASLLDDHLKPVTPVRDALALEIPSYILEPYWSDIVTVLEAEEVCRLYGRPGIRKQGQPARYFFENFPSMSLLGTTDANIALDFRPCRSLMCPAAHVDKVRKCSRCGQAAYCSKTCQMEHWHLHKPHCKAAHKDIKEAQ